jgi:hypothetical protein
VGFGLYGWCVVSLWGVPVPGGAVPT